MQLGAEFSRATKGNSPLHTCDPRIKVVIALLLMVGAFLVNSWQAALVALVGTTIFCYLAGQTPLSVLKGVWPICVSLALVAALNLFVNRDGTTLVQLGFIQITTGGLKVALTFAFRLTLLVMAGALLLITTTPTRLTQGLAALLQPLKHVGVPVSQLAMVLSLALRFVPLLGAEAEAVLDAQIARGAPFATGGPLARVRALPSLMVPIVAGTLRHAQDVGTALEARGYDPNQPRTEWHPLKTKPADWALLVSAAIYVVAIVLL